MNMLKLWWLTILSSPLRYILLFLLVIGAICAAIVVRGDTEFDTYTYATIEVKGDRGGGAGFIYDQDVKNIYILTARHVVCGNGIELAKNIHVQIKGHYWKDKIRWIDHDRVVIHPDLDIAHITLRKNWQLEREYVHLPLDWGAEEPKIGDVVYMVGHPYSAIYDMLNKGIVAAYDTVIFRSISSKGKSREIMVMTAPAYPGNSGGPIIDMRGYAIGVEFGILYTRRGWMGEKTENKHGISYAIKHEDILEFVANTRWGYEENALETGKQKTKTRANKAHFFERIRRKIEG